MENDSKCLEPAQGSRDIRIENDNVQHPKQDGFKGNKSGQFSDQKKGVKPSEPKLRHK